MPPSALPHTDHSLATPGVEPVVNASNIMPDKGECWILHASTGCTCCSWENFVEGPWRTEEGVEARVKSLTEQKRLASQYSKTGHYIPEKVEYERAGRFLILEGLHVVEHGFIEDDENGFGDYEITMYKR